MNEAVKTLELLLQKTEENSDDIALIFPNESADFIQGYIVGSISAFQLALEHVRGIKPKVEKR